MSESLNTNNLPWTTNLRVVATISVIFLHVTSGILYQYGTISNSIWWTGNIYDSLVRFCVPVFVMLTGTLLLNKEYELYDFLKNRFSRIILPFLFWSIIYAFFALRNEFLENPELSFFEICKLTFFLFKNGTSFHLWYIYMIIGIYLFIPILSKWIKNATEKEILYFIFIWLFTIIVDLPFLSKFKININLTYFSGYLGYVILGYYLSVKQFKYSIRRVKFIALLFIFFGVAVTAIGTYFLTERHDVFNGYLYDYLSISVLISSIGFFIFIKNLHISNFFVLRIINFISTFSYGIYLVHILILKFLETLGINYQFTTPLIAIPFTTLLCLLISALVVYSFNSLPYGKYISG